MNESRIMVSLRSSPTDLLKVRFINDCDKSVEIFWVTYSGDYQLYATLRTKQFLDVNTYMRHVWLFREEGTGKRIRANNRLFFYGAAKLAQVKSESRRFLVRLAEARVDELRKICIDSVSAHLTQCTDVKYLEIPVTLKRCLIKRMHRMYPTSHSTIDDFSNCEKNLIDFSGVS